MYTRDQFNSMQCNFIRLYFNYLLFFFFYVEKKTEDDLPICSPHSVCNKVDTYDNPWVERQCRCPGEQSCSMSLEATDGHTITDKTRQFKVK